MHHKNAVGETLGLLQMVNHSCDPNCRVLPVQTRSGLDLLTLQALRDIPEGVEITINYDAQASLASKRMGLTFWQWNPPSSLSAEVGLSRVKCGCAGEGLCCPNKLWRDERKPKMADSAPGLPRPMRNSVSDIEPHSLPSSQKLQSGIRPQPRGQLLTTKQSTPRTVGWYGPTVVAAARNTDRSRLELRQQKLLFSASQPTAPNTAATQLATPVPTGVI